MTEYPPCVCEKLREELARQKEMFEHMREQRDKFRAMWLELEPESDTHKEKQNGE